MEVESIYGILICGILKGSEWWIVIIQLDKFNIAVFVIAAIIAVGWAFCCTGSFSVLLFYAKMSSWDRRRAKLFEGASFRQALNFGSYKVVFAKFSSQVLEEPSFLPRRAKFQSYFADRVYSELTFIGALNGLKVVKSEGHK